MPCVMSCVATLSADAARALRGEPGGGHLFTARLVEALAECDDCDQVSEAPPSTVTVADDRLISSYWDGRPEGVCDYPSPSRACTLESAMCTTCWVRRLSRWVMRLGGGTWELRQAVERFYGA